MVPALGGTVGNSGAREYGPTGLILAPGSAEETRLGGFDAVTVQPGGLLLDEPWTAEPLPHEHLLGGALLDGLPETQQVWMSHGDTATAAPPGSPSPRAPRSARSRPWRTPAGSCTACSSTPR